MTGKQGEGKEKPSPVLESEECIMKKNVKLFSSVEAVKALREQARADMVMGYYGCYGRKVMRRKAGYIMGFKEEVPFRKR